MTKPAGEPIAQLCALGDHYRHVEREHERHPLRSTRRRRIAAEMRRIRDHFERLLVEWISDDGLRARWRSFLEGREPAPEVPPVAQPPLFRGRSDAGALLEIRSAPDAYDIFVDGARVDHSFVKWSLDPDMLGPIQVGEHSYDEVFDAPEPAVRALAEFVAGRAAPPWRWARELIQDGLVDAELALSPRGRRCLERAHPVSAPHGRARNFCVIVADSVRARVLLLDDARVAAGPATSELVEVAEMTNPTLRAHDVDVVADTGTGHRGRTQAPLPLNGPPDHRDHRRRDHERRFAARIADEAAGKWRRYAACELVVVASPVMLGLLRPAIDRLIRAKDQIAVRELAGDLTNLTGSRIHDLLAADKLLPERGRRLLPITTPGAPV